MHVLWGEKYSQEKFTAGWVPETQRRPVPCDGEASNWTLDKVVFKLRSEGAASFIQRTLHIPMVALWPLQSSSSVCVLSFRCSLMSHSLRPCDCRTLYFTISRSLLKLVFTELVMPSNHLVLLTLWGSTNTQFLSFSQKTQIGVVGRVQPYGEQPARSPEGQTPLPGCLQGSSASRLLPSKRKCPRRAFQASCAGPQGYGPASLH